MPRESLKKDVLNYIQKVPVHKVHHPEEIAKALGLRSVSNTRVLLRQLVDDGFLEIVKDKNKRLFTLKMENKGIDPSVVSWPVRKS